MDDGAAVRVDQAVEVGLRGAAAVDVEVVVHAAERDGPDVGDRVERGELGERARGARGDDGLDGAAVELDEVAERRGGGGVRELEDLVDDRGARRVDGAVGTELGARAAVAAVAREVRVEERRADAVELGQLERPVAFAVAPRVVHRRAAVVLGDRAERRRLAAERAVLGADVLVAEAEDVPELVAQDALEGRFRRGPAQGVELGEVHADRGLVVGAVREERARDVARAPRGGCDGEADAAVAVDAVAVFGADVAEVDLCDGFPLGGRGGHGGDERLVLRGREPDRVDAVRQVEAIDRVPQQVAIVLAVDRQATGRRARGLEVGLELVLGDREVALDDAHTRVGLAVDLVAPRVEAVGLAAAAAGRGRRGSFLDTRDERHGSRDRQGDPHAASSSKRRAHATPRECRGTRTPLEQPATRAVATWRVQRDPGRNLAWALVSAGGRRRRRASSDRRRRRRRGSAR